jgi:hypothetical protein
MDSIVAKFQSMQISKWLVFFWGKGSLKQIKEINLKKNLNELTL